MSWTSLDFLAEPWFVIPWYAVGIIGAVWVGYDLATHNTALKTAMKWAWPIIVVFFSVLGLALYVATARPPRIQELEGRDAKKQALDAYERNMVRRVNGAVIHCVAGDGLGVMTGMVIARAIRFSFWEEFWFEYAVGFAFGLFIFQFKSMRMMTDSKLKALAMAFRAEFFSMLTVMAGMGAVMAYVTPMAVTAQPRPLTWAFWGFGALGLVAGYLLTFPMNYMIVKIGWKHGMGSKQDSHPVQGRGAKLALAGAMVALGFVALLVPGWLAVAHVHHHLEGLPQVQERGLAGVQTGARETVATALDALSRGDQQQAVLAVEAAARTAEVLATADPPLASVLDDAKQARNALWLGRKDQARNRLDAAERTLAETTGGEATPPPALARYGGATLLDPHGNTIGEIDHVAGDQVTIALGGVRDFWGFLDLSARRQLTVPAADLVYGPARTVGWSYAVYAPHAAVSER